MVARPRFFAAATHADCTFRCELCGAVARFGVDAWISKGRRGRWFCGEHRPLPTTFDDNPAPEPVAPQGSLL